MITLAQYAGKWLGSPDWTPEVEANAIELLDTVYRLQLRMIEDGFAFPTNPATNSNISGSQYGGFRPQACTIGAPKSNHKIGKAIDLFDPIRDIDTWCMAHLDVLEECGIWIEHPSKTDGWSHWQNVANRSWLPGKPPGFWP